MNDVWLFGMVDVSHTPALGYMQIVPDRSAATLLIIRQHLRNGTIVHSDQWSSYRQVSTLPNVAEQEIKHKNDLFIP